MQLLCIFWAVSLFIVDFADFSIHSNRISGFSMFEFGQIHWFYFFISIYFFFFRSKKYYVSISDAPSIFILWYSFCYYFWITSKYCTFFNFVGLALVVGRPYAYWVWVVAIFVSRAFCQFQSWPFPFSYIITKTTFWLCITYSFRITVFFPHNSQSYRINRRLFCFGHFWVDPYTKCLHVLRFIQFRLKWYETSPNFEFIDIDFFNVKNIFLNVIQIAKGRSKIWNCYS